MATTCPTSTLGTRQAGSWDQASGLFYLRLVRVQHFTFLPPEVAEAVCEGGRMLWWHVPDLDFLRCILEQPACVSCVVSSVGFSSELDALWCWSRPRLATVSMTQALQVLPLPGSALPVDGPLPALPLLNT